MSHLLAIRPSEIWPKCGQRVDVTGLHSSWPQCDDLQIWVTRGDHVGSCRVGGLLLATCQKLGGSGTPLAAAAIVALPLVSMSVKGSVTVLRDY